MGKIFTLTQDIKDLAYDAFSDLVEQLSRPCRLVYPPKQTQCINCIPSAGGRPTNIWRTGGPAPFPLGSLCPVCGGTGYISTEATDDILLLIEQNPTKFHDVGVEIDLPTGTIQAKGFIKDTPKISRCNYIIVDTNLEGLTSNRYKLLSEPVSPGNIVQGAFFVCLLQRAG